MLCCTAETICCMAARVRLVICVSDADSPAETFAQPAEKLADTCAMPLVTTPTRVEKPACTAAVTCAMPDVAAFATIAKPLTIDDWNIDMPLTAAAPICANPLVTTPVSWAMLACTPATVWAKPLDTAVETLIIPLVAAEATCPNPAVTGVDLDRGAWGLQVLHREVVVGEHAFLALDRHVREQPLRLGLVPRLGVDVPRVRQRHR